MINKPFFYSCILLIMLSLNFHALFGQAGYINNDVFWNTKEGQPIYSQGGGIFRFTDPASGIKKYYWFGANYKVAALYRADPSVTQKNASFEAVTCYTSTDLVNWHFENNVLTDTVVDAKGKTWNGRLGVAYIAQLSKYALFMQHGNHVLIAVLDTPSGNYTPYDEIDMMPMIGIHNTGDQTVFKDEDSGKSYLVYSYGRGRNKIYVSEIGVKEGKITLLDCTKVFEGQSREGNCMFKYNGRFYMCASNIYGWDASHVYYLVADDIRGPYLPANDMQIMDGAAQDYGHISQTGFFINVKGSKKETVIYCGDRWADFAGNGLGYNQWVPLSFNGTKPFFNSISSWNLNAQTGEWAVGNNNNYVRNGSFEADRNKIPSKVKPVQEQLLGWETVIVKGNKLSADSTNLDSPTLNYFNTEQDRKVVAGEKSLYINDKVNFERKISQTITSSPDIPLQDGTYTLTAMIKNSKGFETLKIFANTKGKEFATDLRSEKTDWNKIVIKNIAIKNGKVEIGIIAKGVADAWCCIDDILLVHNK